MTRMIANVQVAGRTVSFTADRKTVMFLYGKVDGKNDKRRWDLIPANGQCIAGVDAATPDGEYDLALTQFNGTEVVASTSQPKIKLTTVSPWKTLNGNPPLFGFVDLYGADFVKYPDFAGFVAPFGSELARNWLDNRDF